MFLIQGKLHIISPQLTHKLSADHHPQMGGGGNIKKDHWHFTYFTSLQLPDKIQSGSPWVIYSLHIVHIDQCHHMRWGLVNIVHQRHTLSILGNSFLYLTIRISCRLLNTLFIKADMRIQYHIKAQHYYSHTQTSQPQCWQIQLQIWHILLFTIYHWVTDQNH